MLCDERKIDCTEATKHVPRRNGKRVHASTIFRWMRYGIAARSSERVRLEHQRIGGRLYTSVPALNRFFSLLAQHDLQYFDSRTERRSSIAKQGRTSAARQAAIDRAAAELRAANI